MRTARATIKGFEVMRMFKKGQFKLWIDALGSRSEVIMDGQSVKTTEKGAYAASMGTSG